MRYYADFLWQFLQMTDSELLEELGVSIRNWENFTYLGDLRVAYDHLNSGRASRARSIVLGVIEDIGKNLDWTAEEILRREG